MSVSSFTDAAFISKAIRYAFQRPDDVIASPWAGHIPWMQVVISICRPSIFVELGVYRGCSFLAALSAAHRCRHRMKAYGIDTWAGEHHSGLYDESEILGELTDKVSHYDQDVFLLKDFFANRLGGFADRSIDLLHIDGLHTYEAVRDDFDSWLPKVSDRGIVMFHDTMVRRDDFGVWRLWEEVQGRYPSLSFEHSHGLGVLFVGTDLKFEYGRLVNLLSDDETFRIALVAVCEQQAYTFPGWLNLETGLSIGL